MLVLLYSLYFLRIFLFSVFLLIVIFQSQNTVASIVVTGNLTSSTLGKTYLNWSILRGNSNSSPIKVLDFFNDITNSNFQYHENIQMRFYKEWGDIIIGPSEVDNNGADYHGYLFFNSPFYWDVDLDDDFWVQHWEDGELIGYLEIDNSGIAYTVGYETSAMASWWIGYSDKFNNPNDVSAWLSVPTSPIPIPIPVPVPVPVLGTIWLMGSAILGLMSFSRKNRLVAVT